ncbi:HD domain-containing protein [Adlercreutzia sp. ZJ154]|uniref:HD domain-containing protein n=1 Tax=Adlercreutzia sp. ZJ154 TaxID=2709790 RepID=UPI0013EDBBFB|nr:HD domain-containing protein [Adlercreutzia sp. ZJ154]
MQLNKRRKRYKDPVYGYIKLDEKLFECFIDTPEFQRLRYIRQTGYMPVYSSATHNRFVHSIGVYHLGVLAFDALQKNVSDNKLSIPQDFDWTNCRDVFLKACLLHDVGHAPFSHTGEGLYRESATNIDVQLGELVGSTTFKKDISSVKAANPHETISAMVGLFVYGDHLKNAADKEFFARCITGYLYSAKGEEYEIKNAIISLLNSQTIDVDKLDYLIRDSFETGFKTTVIDYERLLSGVTLCKNMSDNYNEDSEKYELAYCSSSISVLENVVLARDSEKRWIQNHPVIIYEDMLLRHVLKSVSHEFFGNVSELFCLKSLTKEGHTVNEKVIRLLCDDDIISYAKQLKNDKCASLFFDRGLRHKPFWKSEEEFKALLRSRFNGRERVALIRRFVNLENVLMEITDLPFVNAKAIEQLSKYIEEKKGEALLAGTEKSLLESNIKKYETSLEIAKNLLQLAEDQNDCEFAIIATDDFNSGFASGSLENTLISVAGRNRPVKLKEVSRLFEAEKSDDKFFYIYSNKKEELPTAKIVNWIYDDVRSLDL